MNVEKKLLQKTVDTLVDTAEDCLDAAKTHHAKADGQQRLSDQQHQMADKQHAMAGEQAACADKLEEVGHALTDVAVEIKGEMEWQGARSSAPLLLREDDVPPPIAPALPRPVR